VELRVQGKFCDRPIQTNHEESKIKPNEIQEKIGKDKERKGKERKGKERKGK